MLQKVYVLFFSLCINSSIFKTHVFSKIDYIMIQFEKISKFYGADAIIQEATFTLGKKEKCAIVGKNGTGKTTLFRLICGIEFCDSGAITVPKDYRIGHLSQHIHFSQETIQKEASLALVDSHETYKADAILCGLGFSECALQKHPEVLSGGYALRLHLAKLLLSEPDCLLLDEPTNYLDIHSIEWLVRFLQNWPREMMLISHDRLLLDAIATHTLGICRQNIKKIEGSTSKYYKQLAYDEMVYEKTRENQEKKRKHLQSFIDRFGAKNTKAAQAQSRFKALSRLPELDALAAMQNLSFRFPVKVTPSKSLLRINNICFSYGDTPLIDNLSFEVQKQSRLCIIGQNGKGKSTLLKLLMGELTPTHGSIGGISEPAIGYFGQSHIERLNPHLTVEQEVHHTNPLLSTQEVRSICGKMLFSQARYEKPISVLSGGEKSRVVLAKLLAKESHMLILDEPTNHLDIESTEAFMQALETFPQAVIIVSHSELILERVASSLIIFEEEGQKVFLGTYAEFLEQGGWQKEQKTSVKKPSSYKEAKKERAQLINERAKSLKAHTSQQKKLEDAITKLEQEVTLHTEKILQASNQGLFAAEDTKAVKLKQAEIEQLFLELETEHAKAEEIKARFEALLSG